MPLSPLFTVYVGIGSNIEPKINAELALQQLIRHFRVDAHSPFYLNTAIGPVSGGNMFLNGVARFTTRLDRHALKRALVTIEEKFGRGCERFQPRRADLDIIIHYDESNPENAHIHSDLLKRDFVYLPLLDIDANFVHPQLQLPLSELLRKLPTRPMEKLYFEGSPTRSFAQK